MFEKIKEVIRRMFNKNDITKAFNIDVGVSDKMMNAIRLWSNMFENNSPWLNEEEGIVSLNLAATISSELARLATIEFESEITGSKRADYLNEQYRVVKDNLKIQTEYGNAKGGLVFKPYIKDEKIYVDYIQADKFIPVKFDSNNKMTGAVFITQLTKADNIYTRLEYQMLEGTNFHVVNKVYKSKMNNVLGSLTSLESVEEWKDIKEKTTLLNIEKPLFGYYKVPLANNIDVDSPLGVSVYARAISDIKRADIQYGRLDWEYEASEKAIFADATVLKSTNDKTKKLFKTPHLKKRLFKSVEAEEDFFKDYSPEVRDEAFIRGLNKAKQEIELKCGLAYGTISDPQYIEKTAEEIRTSKQRSFSTVSDIQKALQIALDDLIYAMDVLATLYELAPVGKYETSYQWDDSIIVNRDKEFADMRQLVADSIISRGEFRSWHTGEPLDVAEKNLPQMESMLGGYLNVNTH